MIQSGSVTMDAIIDQIPVSSLKRLATKAGIDRVATDAYYPIAYVLYNYANIYLTAAAEVASGAGRTTLSERDIEYAIHGISTSRERIPFPEVPCTRDGRNANQDCYDIPRAVFSRLIRDIIQNIGFETNEFSGPVVSKITEAAAILVQGLVEKATTNFLRVCRRLMKTKDVTTLTEDIVAKSADVRNFVKQHIL